MSPRRLLPLAVAASCALSAAPARAVVNGEPITPQDVPFFASVTGCGGSLVAPDRVLTAGHCVAHFPEDALAAVVVGGVPRATSGVAMHPGYRTLNGRAGPLDDVAIVRLAEPVTDVVPAALGGSPSGETRIVGSGRTVPPGARDSERGAYGGGLRTAVLRAIPDAECAAAYRTRRGNDGERFDARRMLCATDPDGVAPFSSGCNGDSGGPLWTGTKDAPVVFGVVSFGGLRCGADRLPSVFAAVDHFRSFITDPAPQWAPRSLSPPRVTGTLRAGGTLRCSVYFVCAS